MPVPSARGKATAALQWLGLPGVILLAALLCDILIILPAGFDGVGTTGSDLFLLPGIVAVSACVPWARTQPVTATWAAAAALLLSTALIRVGDAAAFTVLLSNISFAETVAGVELVYLCVRAVRGGMAFVSVAVLVVATVVAAFGRDAFMQGGSELVQTLVGGLVLLVLAVVLGWQLRKSAVVHDRNALTGLLREHWPLVGGFTLVLFLETFQAAASGPIALAALACSAAAAVSAVLSAHYPERASFGLASAIAVSGLIMWAGNHERLYATMGGIPPTQVVAGMVLVVFLVRYGSPARAAGYIGLLSGVVAVVALVGARSDAETIRALFIAALLLLGIAVATGLYFRARDSERVKTVEAAVTEAQTSERMALARELHDVVAHHVTGIVVQAQAARMVAERDPRVVVDALGQIEDAGTEAMVAMRRLVRSMRGDDHTGGAELSEQATTDLGADLRRLAEASSHGVATEVELDLPDDLPQEVARSALRIVQESLTNVGKHADGATLARVSAWADGGELHIRVSDNGIARPGADDDTAARHTSCGDGGGRRPGGVGGYGLIGMRERVDLLHGRLSAGQRPEGGWLVDVSLPLEGETTG